MADTEDTTVQQEDLNYAVLGIQNGKGAVVSRVRMFVGDKAIDEDITLPRVITIEEQLHGAITERIKEIQSGVKPEDSKITQADGNQTVNDEFTVPEDVVATDSPVEVAADV